MQVFWILCRFAKAEIKLRRTTLEKLSCGFLDLWLQPERSYKLGSVLPSVHLSSSFLGIGSLVFSETLYGLRGPYSVLQNSIFLEKLPSSKNDQNRSKIVQKWAFAVFTKIYSLVFLWKWCRMKVIMML